MKKTEIELINEQRLGLILAEHALKDRIDYFDQIDSIMPGHFHVNDASSLALTYIGASGSEYLNRSSKELIKMGKQFLLEYIHPDSTTYSHPKLAQFASSSHPGNTFCYFEKVRRGTDTLKYSWFLSVCKTSIDRKTILCNSIPINKIDAFSQQISRLLDDNVLIRKNFRQFASLTKRELDIIRMIAKGYSRSQVAELLRISIHTLDQHRKNIRSKLNVSRFSEIIRYVEALGLI